MNEHLAKFLAWCDEDPYHHGVWHNGNLVRAVYIATELRALLADRDAWKAKAAPVPPVRKLREVKAGADIRFRWNPSLGPRAEFFAFDSWRECNHTQVLLHADLFDDLKKQPYEPVETVEDVVRALVDHVDGHSIGLRVMEFFSARIRQAVHAETPGAA